MNWLEIQKRLHADRGQWSRIARATGLHINAVTKIANGQTPSPRIDTVEKIIAYYESIDRGRASRSEDFAA